MPGPLQVLQSHIPNCTLCPRLTDHCRHIAQVKRRAYRDDTYWGRPVPGFGDPKAQLLIVGLAPGAHGANRTGRMFTGDRSGDFLLKALHQTGFANQPTSTHRNDGLKLINAYLTASARCAPPDNKPTQEELDTCRPYLLKELELLKNIKVVVCLGRIAIDSYSKALNLPRQHFAHNLLLNTAPPIISSYHPSQQNTQTGRLTMPMLIDVFRHAASLITS
ncbi:MAG: uracil-DNA glycosylase [Acidobacteria bacterium]|nr:uracil-DNA glycosylase [Acidobacteriota bacterium]